MSQGCEHYQAIAKHLQSFPETVGVAKPGWCRVWTREAIYLLKEYQRAFGLAFLIQAREIDLEPGFSHTYLRVIIGNASAWTMDGTGTLRFPAYFGPESESHFDVTQSKFDPIHFYDVNPDDYGK